MYACMHVCMYACMHVCMDGWMDGWMDVCMYVCMYVCTYVWYFFCLWSTWKLTPPNPLSHHCLQSEPGPTRNHLAPLHEARRDSHQEDQQANHQYRICEQYEALAPGRLVLDISWARHAVAYLHSKAHVEPENMSSLPQCGTHYCLPSTAHPSASESCSRATRQSKHQWRRAHPTYETSCRGCRGIGRHSTGNSTVHSIENI